MILPDRRRRRPIALIYRGPASTPGCAEAAAALISGSEINVNIAFTGPHEAVPLCRDTLAQACLYVQPGGPSLRRAYRLLRQDRHTIASYVHAGGRYLGLCLGGYLAGRTPGFDLLPGDAERYIDTAGSTVTGAGDTTVQVTWGGTTWPVFFQDGPTFTLDRDHDVEVLATYPNGRPAALLTRRGQGAVAVVGPHPEATADWFLDARLPLPSRLAIDLGVEVTRALVTR